MVLSSCSLSSGDYFQDFVSVFCGRSWVTMDEELEKLWSKLQFLEDAKADLNVLEGDDGQLDERGKLCMFRRSELDKKRVLEGMLWSFDNHLVLLLKYDGNAQPMNLQFRHCPLWIQECNLPFNSMNQATGRIIGEKLGGKGRRNTSNQKQEQLIPVDEDENSVDSNVHENLLAPKISTKYVAENEKVINKDTYLLKDVIDGRDPQSKGK
ncbi:unnamed protein product [Ilex paraguariensis]|uniref:DUF4283 domain-containing protein n=1 Tax=Ilex paraguariensis TaxID=185542 RepID=A0ABC8TD35_9AQUA